jgi:peptidylprolyl isomerase
VPLVGLALLLAGCGGGSSAAPSGSGCDNDVRSCMEQRTTPPPTVIEAGKSYTATVHTPRGQFSIRLDPAAAPVTVNNFVYLSEHRFYDRLTFHRVEPGFVVQGGDPRGDGTGGPGYRLPDETNPAPWLKGSVGMASSSAGVSGSQFFILLGDAPHLATSGVYNHFGVVSGGSDVVAAIRPGDRIERIDIATA